jgi:hypothetical protein
VGRVAVTKDFVLDSDSNPIFYTDSAPHFLHLEFWIWIQIRIQKKTALRVKAVVLSKEQIILAMKFKILYEFKKIKEYATGISFEQTVFRLLSAIYSLRKLL